MAFQLIDDLQRRGVPLDGVGLQAHLLSRKQTSLDRLNANSDGRGLFEEHGQQPIFQAGRAQRRDLVRGQVARGGEDVAVGRGQAVQALVVGVPL